MKPSKRKQDQQGEREESAKPCGLKPVPTMRMGFLWSLCIHVFRRSGLAQNPGRSFAILTQIN